MPAVPQYIRRHSATVSLQDTAFPAVPQYILRHSATVSLQDRAFPQCHNTFGDTVPQYPCRIQHSRSATIHSVPQCHSIPAGIAALPCTAFPPCHVQHSSSTAALLQATAFPQYHSIPAGYSILAALQRSHSTRIMTQCPCIPAVSQQ